MSPETLDWAHLNLALMRRASSSLRDNEFQLKCRVNKMQLNIVQLYEGSDKETRVEIENNCRN